MADQARLPAGRSGNDVTVELCNLLMGRLTSRLLKNYFHDLFPSFPRRRESMFFGNLRSTWIPRSSRGMTSLRLIQQPARGGKIFTLFSEGLLIHIICYSGSFFPVALKMLKFPAPHFWSLNFTDVARTPNPYLTLLLKLIDEASSKYLVGQLISPILKPK
jgi:hypothetical protein